MMTLYYSPGAASLAVHWLLIELGIAHELRSVDFASRQQKSADYLQLNPSGVVPTLVVDGEPRTEVAALVMQLADTHPEAALAPALGSDARAHYYQWIAFCANTLQPAFRRWYYPDEPAGADNAELVKAAAERDVGDSFDRLDAHLGTHGPYLLGEQVSAADFYLVMLMRWSRNLPRQALDWPNLRRLADLMRARPSWAQLYAAEDLSEWA